MGFLNDVRLIIDPLFLKLKEDLYGSGISYGRISPGALPTTIVYETNITEILDGSGYLIDPTTTNGDIIVRSGGEIHRLPSGPDGYYLRVNAGIPVWSNPPSGTDPTVNPGDIVYRDSSSLTRLGIGTSGQVLIVVSGFPAWTNITYPFTNPMTTAGDLIYGISAGNPARLPIGSNGQYLVVVSGIPTWSTLSLNTTISGQDVIGLLPNGLKVTGIQNIPVSSGVPTTADRLRYNGSQWEASSKIWQPLTNGSTSSPELIFASGDVIMVEI